MISYNNRYRGPYEYDKFILNILQFHNIVEHLDTYEVNGATDAIDTIKSLHDEVNTVFDDFISGHNSLSEEIFFTIMKKREEFI